MSITVSRVGGVLGSRVGRPIELLKLQPTQGTTAVVGRAGSPPSDLEARVNNGNVFLIVFSKTSEGAKWLMMERRDATRLDWKAIDACGVGCAGRLTRLTRFPRRVRLQAHLLKAKRITPVRGALVNIFAVRAQRQRGSVSWQFPVSSTDGAN